MGLVHRRLRKLRFVRILEESIRRLSPVIANQMRQALRRIPSDSNLHQCWIARMSDAVSEATRRCRRKVTRVGGQMCAVSNVYGCPDATDRSANNRAARRAANRLQWQLPMQRVLSATLLNPESLRQRRLVANNLAACAHTAADQPADYGRRHGPLKRRCQCRLRCGNQAPPTVVAKSLAVSFVCYYICIILRRSTRGTPKFWGIKRARRKLCRIRCHRASAGSD